MLCIQIVGFDGICVAGMINFNPNLSLGLEVGVGVITVTFDHEVAMGKSRKSMIKSRC